MDDLQIAFEQIIQEELESGHSRKLTPTKLGKIALRSSMAAGRDFYHTLIASAPPMLERRRREAVGFERRNFRRWRRAFDLLETIWVSCEELGAGFNKVHRSDAIRTENYSFEALTHLHAKALLVTSEIICLLKGGFADGAMARWRTLYEVNVIAALIRQEGHDLALRYLAHADVQAWKELEARGNIQRDESIIDLEARAAFALGLFGEELNRRNGWACDLTGQKNPTFEGMAKMAGRERELSLYRHASHHIHSNHRGSGDLLGMCEAEEQLLLVGPSNSGMVMPVTVAALSLVENTSFLLLSQPNLDRIAFSNTLMTMAKRMRSMAPKIEERSYQTAKRRRERAGMV